MTRDELIAANDKNLRDLERLTAILDEEPSLRDSRYVQKQLADIEAEHDRIQKAFAGLKRKIRALKISAWILYVLAAGAFAAAFRLSWAWNMLALVVVLVFYFIGESLQTRSERM